MSCLAISAEIPNTPRCTVSQRVLSALDESCRTCTHGTNHDHYLVTLGESMKLEAFAAGVSAGVLFASSGKNLGPAGVCLAIIRDDLLRDQDR